MGDGRYTDKDTQRPGSTGKQSLKNEDNEEPCGTDDDSEPLCKLVRDKENDSHFNFLTDAKLQKLCKRATSMPMLHKCQSEQLTISKHGRQHASRCKRRGVPTICFGQLSCMCGCSHLPSHKIDLFFVQLNKAPLGPQRLVSKNGVSRDISRSKSSLLSIMDLVINPLFYHTLRCL